MWLSNNLDRKSWKKNLGDITRQITWRILNEFETFVQLCAVLQLAAQSSNLKPKNKTTLHFLYALCHHLTSRHVWHFYCHVGAFCCLLLVCGIFSLCISKIGTVKLGNKELFDKEQIGIKEPFPVTNSPFTS